MSFKDVEIKQEYRSFNDNMVEDFYYPLLSKAKLYERAVGFFSSTALIEISKGISGLVENGGKIRLIASPKLSGEDVEAIEKGLQERKSVITNSINKAILEPENEYEERRLDLLANLVAANVLEIKIAVVENEAGIGMYHEKMGLLYDYEENIVAFSGSMNESTTAFSYNMENIDVYKSWEGESERQRVMNKKVNFDAMWNDYEPHIRIMDFPEASREKLFEYRKSSEIDLSLDRKEDWNQSENNGRKELKEGTAFTEWFSIRDYQKSAIQQWEINNYIGIFDMATGTGKTLTGLSAVVRLYQHVRKGLAIFIVCPYQHLVSQWVEDIESFNIKPVICHSASPQKHWASRLKDACMALEFGASDYMCGIFTNATYSSKKVQNIIEGVKDKALLLVDEAHNFGAEKLSKCLDEKIPYRLALSATLERHGDSAGTEKLFNYFKNKCIEYSLKDAIENDMLVRYYYHPVVVSFESEELNDYLELTKKIGKLILGNKKKEISDQAKMLLIKRARLVAAARQKVDALVDEMKDYMEENHILVYCGATTMKDVDYKEGKPLEEEKRQIDIVMKRLGLELNMKVAKFTSEEDAQKREILKREFDEGESIQALIAIRCLDEGINIPSIRKAFILASSTNPKEYIQRRGRVLRKCPGKKYADIYDFIMSPIPLDMVDSYNESIVKMSASLVKREIERMKDFAALAENSSEADEIIYELMDKYQINYLDEEEFYE